MHWGRDGAAKPQLKHHGPSPAWQHQQRCAKAAGSWYPLLEQRGQIWLRRKLQAAVRPLSVFPLTLRLALLRGSRSELQRNATANAQLANPGYEGLLALVCRTSEQLQADRKPYSLSATTTTARPARKQPTQSML